MNQGITALSLIIVASYVGFVMGGDHLDAVYSDRRISLQSDENTVGWWGTLMLKSGRYCRLLNFPQANLFSFSPIGCTDSSYDRFWMWRIAEESGKGSITRGDTVYLMSYNPAPMYCKLFNGIVGCGVSKAAATKFTIEAERKTSVINLATGGFRLKVGTQYCGLTGSGGAQRLKCSGKKAQATIFQLPSSSLAFVKLVNSLSNMPCGANPRPTLWPKGIVCSSSTVGNQTAALATPGNPVVEAGDSVGFKTYPSASGAYMTSWVLVNDQITDDDVDSKNAGQWFSLERLSGSSTGGALTNNTLVALKSRTTGKYCGISMVQQDAIRCDADGPVSTLPDGYMYWYLADVS